MEIRRARANDYPGPFPVPRYHQGRVTSPGYHNPELLRNAVMLVANGAPEARAS